jgi:hypothetical protein
MTQKRTISSWTELTAWLERSREQGWLFRGEADVSHGSLKPKVGRVSERSGSPRKHPYTLADELRAFEDFKRAARPYLSAEPRSEIEWLSIAQHHGLPTRLLDWTENLFVAASFAVEKAGKAEGAIYCIRGLEDIVEKTKGQQSLFELTSVKTYRPPHISPRIPVQQSVFTIHPNPVLEFDYPELQKWHIHPGACWPIKRNLNAAGITLASLFPDIDGVCRHLSWLYKWSYFDGLKDPDRGRS